MSIHSRSSHWFVLTPETLIAPGVTPFQLMARPQFQAELVSAWLCSIHHSKPVQWECEHVGFICSKVQAAWSPLIKYVALQLLKSVTHMDCNGDMKLCLRNWSSNQNFTCKGSAAFLSACLYESFLQMWHTVLKHMRWNSSHSLSVFSSLALRWNNLTSARNFDQQGKFHLHCCKIPLVRQLRMHLLMDLHKRSCDIYTLSPWDCDSNFGKTGNYISRPFQLRSMQWWGNTVNNLKSFYKWHLKMPFGPGKEDRTFI